jgi:hypothetical protein
MQICPTCQIPHSKVKYCSTSCETRAITNTVNSADAAYRGNNKLKKPGIGIEWTEELLAEYIRCKNDPIYFCSTYLKIINVDDGLIDWTPYDYQVEMIRSMAEERYTIVATARQAGKTTAICGFILWYIIFHPDKTVALLANKGDTAREILGRIQNSYQHLPAWLQQGVGNWNKGSFELENNSRVLAGSTSSDSIRGYSINLLFIDEAAFIENWDEFFTSVFPTISSGKTTKICLVSTPFGLNHFWKLWKETGYEEGDERRNQYNPIKVTWDKVPGRDEKWRIDTLQGMSNDIEKFEQEYCVQFQGSSGTLISGASLRELSHRTPLSVKDGLWIYEHPIRDHQYTMIADVSRGKGLDYSAFHIIDISQMPYKQVCVFRDNAVPPQEYAEILYRIGTHYNQACALVEINDIGGQVVDALHDMNYENVLKTTGLKGGRNGKQISIHGGPSSERGIRTTVSTKATGCSMAKLLIEQKQLMITDFHTIEELSRFSRKGKSYEAEPGATDDLVMGLVIFGWLTTQQYFKELTDINTIANLRERSEEQIERDLLPMGVVTTNDWLNEAEVVDLSEPDSALMSFEQWLAS